MSDSNNSIDLEHTELLTVDQLKSLELVEEIYLIEDQSERSYVINNCRDRAKVFGVVKAFENLCRGMERKLKDLRRNEIAKQKQKALAKGSEESEKNVWVEPYSQTLYNTGRWVVGENGILKADSRFYTVACNYPVFILERMRVIESGKEKLTLAWIKEGHLWTIPALRSQISAANRITYLADTGFPVNSENARHLVAYLDDFEKLNPDIPWNRSTGRFGWVGIGSKYMDFVPYCADKVTFEVEGFKDLVESVRTRGDYNVWLTMMNNLRASGRNEIMVYLAASFGSVLIPLLKTLPFITNLYGTTGAGKTVALMVAASVWANPAEHAYFSESNSTTNAITKKLGVLNNLPLMLDDLSKIRDQDKRKFTELIYAICSGGGKGRLDRNTNMREVEKWDNITLSNLERPLTDETMQGGAINRVLDFEISEGSIFEDGNAVVTVLSQHYGHAGQKWVKFLIDTGIDTIKEVYLKYESRLREAATASGTPKEQKQIASAAVLLTADELSEQAIFNDGRRLDFDYVFNAIKDIKTTSEMERAYWFVTDYVIQCQSRFKPDSYGDYKGEIWGAFLDDDYTAIIPTAMKQIAEAGNFDSGQFLKWLNRSGLLQTAKGHLTKLVRLKGFEDKKPIRAHVMRLGVTDDDPAGTDSGQAADSSDASDVSDLKFAEPGEQESDIYDELPFA